MQVVEDFRQRTALETDVHRLSGIFAVHHFLGARCEVDVFRREFQTACVEVEAHELAAFAGEGQHALQRSDERAAVDGELVRVALRNHRVVVRIAAFDEAAGQHALGETDFSRAVVELDDDFLLLLAQHVFQQRGRLFRQDECGGCLALDVEILVSHEFVAVAGNHGQTVGSQVEVDAVHHRAKFVLSRGEERARQVVVEHRRVDADDRGVVGNLLRTRIFVAVLRREVVQTVLIDDFNRQILGVHLERERLFGQFLHRVEQCAVGHSEVALAVNFVELQRRAHHVFAVARRDGELLVIHFEQETVENRQGVLAVDDPCQCLEATAQSSAGYGKFHCYLKFKCLISGSIEQISHKNTKNRSSKQKKIQKISFF